MQEARPDRRRSCDKNLLVKLEASQFHGCQRNTVQRTSTRSSLSQRVSNQLSPRASPRDDDFPFAQPRGHHDEVGKDCPGRVKVTQE